MVAQKREARVEAETASMRERLAVTEGISSSEHAQNTRISNPLQELGQRNDILMQRLVEAEETVVTQRTKTT